MVRMTLEIFFPQMDKREKQLEKWRERSRVWYKKNKKRKKDYAKQHYQENKDEIRTNRQELRKQSKNIEKAQAHAAVQLALKKGLLIRSEQCSNIDCDSVSTEIQAHHYLGYNEKNWLDVQWLCKSCHIRVDKGCFVIKV